eukprot:TRINITY_DN3142_c0_g1_i4.p1 TRINITY_DN3142_c0_g1~~TRINITY_DN3142_c0_g1_i4.p1  ORF type:complete len:218 (-),score=17.92 TRINITY_DN3142_c0_g1_i4:251-904(-)
MACIWGAVGCGYCDYFEYGGRNFYVNQQFWHVQFMACCPAQKAVLVVADNPQQCYRLDEVSSGVEERCRQYAYVRTWLSVVGGYMCAFFSLIMFSSIINPIIILFQFLGFGMFIVGISLIFYKPTALQYHQQMYIQYLEQVMFDNLMYENQERRTNRQRDDSFESAAVGQVVKVEDIPMTIAVIDNAAFSEHTDNHHDQLRLLTGQVDSTTLPKIQT